MGGHKKGQAQRTKNNAKPASSGRIAELVDKGHQFPSFSSFNSEQRAAVNAPIPVDILGPNVDPNFSVVLKKMAKKDATTRFKALQELKELCKESKPEVIVEVLPVWCKVYTLLAIDVEHRVREAVQDVHRLIVSMVGRNLAPHLKVITPLWFLSQYDSYAPAASIASVAFQEAFPPHKITEVITFCQAEILEYIKGNLLSLTPQDLSKGDLTKEEMDLKYERVLICSLNGYALYLSKVTLEQINKYEPVHKEILTSSKFWKFSKYKTPGVRSAWFLLLSSLCQHALHLLESGKKHVASSVIGSIDDYDSSVLSVVWEAALRSFSAIPDFWQNVNIDKFFLPKFTNILRVGGQGNASCIYPNIILLLNSIPDSVINDKSFFYGKIFQSFFDGMKQPLVYQSPSECAAVFSSFMECIQYISMKNPNDQALSSLILDYLFQVISASMSQVSFRNQIKPLYNHLYQLLIFWEKYEDSSYYVELRNNFWKNLSSLSIENFNKALVDMDQLQFCLKTHSQMLTILGSPVVLKRKMKVSFADDVKEETKEEKSNISVSEKSIAEQKIENSTVVLAGALLESYYNVAIDNNYQQYQSILISQIQDTVDLFKGRLIPMIKSFKSDWSTSWTNSLQLWIQNKEIPTQSIFGLLFETLVFLDPPQKEKLINHLCEDRCQESLIEGFKLATHSENAVLKEWLLSEKIQQEICKIFSEIESTESSSFQTISCCWYIDKQGDFVVGNSTASALLEQIKNQLFSSDPTKVKIAAVAVQKFVDGISCCEKHEKLLSQFLGPLFVNILIGRDCSVYDSWYSSVALLSKSRTGQDCIFEHIQYMASTIENHLSDVNSNFDVRQTHKSVIVILNLLIGNSDEKMMKYGINVISKILSSVNSKECLESCCYIEDVVTLAEIIHSNLLIEGDLGKDVWTRLKQFSSSCSKTLSFVNSLVLSLKITASILGINIGTDDTTEEDNEGEYEENTLKLPRFPLELNKELCSNLVGLIYGLVLLKKVETYYYFTEEYFRIASFVRPLEVDLKEVLKRCKSEVQDNILKIIEDRIVADGNLWKFAKQLLLEFLNRPSPQDIDNETLSEEHLNPSTVLSVQHLAHKLEKIIKKGQMDPLKLNQILKLICEKYRQLYTYNETNRFVLNRDYLILTTEIARLLRAAISVSPFVLAESIWDIIRLNTVNWLKIASFTNNFQEYHIEFVMFLSAVCNLLSTLTTTFAPDPPPPELVTYIDEWEQVFSDDAFYYLFKAWEIATGEHGPKNPIEDIHCEILGKTLCLLCSTKKFCKLKKTESGIKKWLKVPSAGILMPSVPVQITSYELLILFLPHLMALDEDLDESSLELISCNLIESELSSTQMVVMAMLQDYSIGISCSVAPFTDSYVYSLGYLLLWSVVMKYCYICETSQKYIYPLWIREKGIVSPFMEAIVKLMPECVLYYQECTNKRGQEFFTVSPSMSFDGWTSEKLSRLSCWLLTELMGHLPAVVRQWASEAEPKHLAIVDKITTTFVSPFLCSREMEAIKSQQKSFDNMKVYTYPSVSEVVAIYTVEECSTELSVQLTSNYPLSPPKVDVSKAMVSTIQTKGWLKQLTIFLTHQNGSIWDGLILWKNNLDKKFEGIEECYICFSILHTTTHQLPKNTCSTCKKRFHSFCLYKWFTTSNKSTCPICRAVF